MPEAGGYGLQLQSRILSTNGWGRSRGEEDKRRARSASGYKSIRMPPGVNLDLSSGVCVWGGGGGGGVRACWCVGVLV